jgi:hypothetical protein
MSTVLTGDGKVGKPARAYIKICERLALHLTNATVTDSRVMHRYYLERFGADTECISYGADVPSPPQPTTLTALGLRPRGYLLLVGRLVPDNCVHHLVDAFERLETDLQCVIVGMPRISTSTSRICIAGDPTFSSPVIFSARHIESCSTTPTPWCFARRSGYPPGTCRGHDGR